MRCEISARRNPTVVGAEVWSLRLHQEGGAGRQQESGYPRRTGEGVTLTEAF